MKSKSFTTICAILCTVLIFNGFLIVSSGEEFDVNAKSALLMDAGSGKVIYEKNAHDRLPPASVTKIMTMLLAMEAIESKKISLEDKVIISDRASSMGGSQLYLEPGEEKTVEQLLKGVAVASANDGAVALGEYIAGNEELFVKMMNDRAKELGMNNTQFMNTNGLPQEGHYTSAYDIGIMSKELLKHPKIHEWLTIWMSSMKVGLVNKRITNLELTNTNKLIKTYPGANGIKTGYTSDAKYCLSASATKNGLTLISVILGSPSSNIRFAEATNLLNYGFATYSSVQVARKNQVIDKISVEKGKEDKVTIVAKDNLNAIVKKGEEKSIQKEFVMAEIIKAPFAANEKVGEIIVTKDGEEIARVELVTESGMDSASFIDIFNKIIKKTVQ